MAAQYSHANLAGPPPLPDPAIQNSQYVFRSPRQAQVFAVIMAYFQQYHCIPSYRHLCTAFDWKSLDLARKALDRLKADGLLVEIAPRAGTGGRAMLIPAGMRPRNAKLKRAKGIRATQGTRKVKAVTDA